MTGPRRAYAFLALVYFLFVAHESFAPFRPRLPGPRALVETLGEARFADLGVRDVRLDFAANALLLLPLGFLIAAARAADRGPGGGAGLRTALAVGLALAPLAALIEVAQVFFPATIVSPNDAIAGALGGALGAALWLAAEARARRARISSYVERFLVLYAAVFAIGSLLASSLSGLLPVPAEVAIRTAFEVVIRAAFAIPVGLLAGGMADGARTWRTRLAALISGLAFVALLEVGRTLLHERAAAAMPVLADGIGVALGVVTAAPIRAPEPR